MHALVIIASLIPASNAWSEFGRHPQEGGLFQRHRILGPGQFGKSFRVHESAEKRILDAFEEIIDGESFMELSLSMSMSMNMASDDVAIEGSPTGGPKSSFMPSQIPSDGPSLAPTGTSGTAMPTAAATPTTAPDSAAPSPARANTPATDVPTIAIVTTNPQPGSEITSPPTVQQNVFECTAGGLSLGDATDENTTVIFLAVGYRAESTSNTTGDFVSELESKLLETAVNAALGCDSNNGSERRHMLEHARTLQLVGTVSVASCEATIAEAESCTVMETELVFFLNGDVDSDEAAFLAYKAIEEGMANNTCIGVVPTLVKLEFLSPLPLPIPPQLTGAGSNTNPPQVANSARAGGLSLSPVTIGACIATIMGGLVSITVWSRNRRARNQRHIQLMEEDMEAHSRNSVAI